MDALTINNISDLQIALLEDNNPAIMGYIERLDRETSNEAFTRAGETFSFPTVEIEGVVRTSSGHLASVFGYKQTNALTELLERRGISGIKLGGFAYDTQIKIREKLNLDPQDRKTILYDWPAFLVGGMNSTNDEARIVQAYLLKAEKVARVGVVAVRGGSAVASFPEPAHGIVMAKLAKEAWRGNPLAAHILEEHYAVPVRELLHRTDPELSESAGLISQYLHFIAAFPRMYPDIKVSIRPDGGRSICGTSDALYRAFLDTARRHHLTQFFSSVYNLGTLLGREADALSMLGWGREYRKVNGYRVYTFDYKPPAPDVGLSMN